MKRLLGWFLALAVLLGIVWVVGPAVVDVDWGSAVRGRTESSLSDQNYRKIENGMTRQDVTNVLGLPSEDHMGTMAGSGRLDDGARYLSWSDGNIQVLVYFNPEGVVISKKRNSR
jgi:hypothetical protein